MMGILQMRQLKTERSLSRKDKATASIQSTKEGSIRMNININRVFYKQIKQKALDEDTSVTELVKKALRAYISK